MKRTTFDFPVSLMRGGEPLRAQLIRGLRAAVQGGRLAAGSALPATRVLASDLGVSRGLVVEAYEQLLAEGYLIAKRGAATRVAGEHPAGHRDRRQSGIPRPMPQPAPPPRFDFRPGVPDVSLFPARAWMRALRRAWAGGSSVLLDYPDPRGVEAARIALATYLNRSRATIAEPDRVVMCTGFAQAARLVGEVLRERGVRRIAVEDPGHAEQCADLGAAGLELVPVPVDASGLVVDRLLHTDAGAVLVAPAHQYPTGAVLDPARRAALLEWAVRRGAFIIEDDYDAEYRYDHEPVGAIQGLAPERVVYVGSASKMLAPSLRQGWLVLPDSLAAGVAAAKLAADRGSPALEQRALAAFLEAGELDRHLRRTRAIYRRRRDALVDALRACLPDAGIRGVAAGTHLLVDLPPGVDEAPLVEAAARAAIRVYPASVYHARPDAAPPALLLGYGSIVEADIEPGVKRLAGLIRGGH
jgi:GntR family transcriptional regulator/MocR family aminotransferase